MVEFPLDTTRAVFNLALSGAFTRFPRIRWIVPHAGAALGVLVDRVDLFSRSITPTDPPVDLLHELGRLYYDLAGVPLPRALPALLGLVSVSQLLYGSDFPFTPAGRVHDLAVALQETDHLTSSARTAVLHANAARLFPRLQTGDSPSA
jgi:predicted TIM-barrel fold metal-dependent hydrolase